MYAGKSTVSTAGSYGHLIHQLGLPAITGSWRSLGCHVTEKPRACFILLRHSRLIIIIIGCGYRKISSNVADLPVFMRCFYRCFSCKPMGWYKLLLLSLRWEEAFRWCFGDSHSTRTPSSLPQINTSTPELTCTHWMTSHHLPGTYIILHSATTPCKTASDSISCTHTIFIHV